MTPRASLLFLALASTAGTLTPEVLAAAPRYKMVLGQATPEHGVQTVSLVQNPAIQRGWVALSAADTTAPKRFHLSAADAPHKQVLTGPALLPGQEILRLDAQGQPFYITFDAATIEATARRFAAQGRHNSTNQDHAVSLTGNVVYENWIVADPEKDKAAALGLSVEPGTWMLSVHIPDADYWQTEVVTGNKTGFSIEGLFDTEQLTLSAVAPAPTPVKKNWVSTLFAALKSLGNDQAAGLRLSLGLEQLADGRAVSIDDTTGIVLLVGADGTPGEALLDGTYQLANGGELVVQQGKRADTGGQGAPTGTDLAGDKQPAPAADAAPAPLAENAGLPELVKTVNELIKAVGGKQATAPNPVSDPAAPKMAAALHGVKLADVAAKFTELKLDAIELENGDKLTLNPVSRRLANADGSLVESGYFAAADGSYFCVSTDQWFYQIDKQTYDSVYAAKLQAVQLAEAKAKLAQEPGGKVIKLHGDEATADRQPEAVPPHRAFLQSVRAANSKVASS